MTQADNRERERFAELCAADRIMNPFDGDGIGTYNEKRIHRIFKRMVTENANCYEEKIGSYVADVVFDGSITEIQTASFRSLEKKIQYYLDNTDMNVTVIHPVIRRKQIIRAEKDTGEILSSKKSPKNGSDIQELCELYHLRHFFPNPRLKIELVHIAVEEYRFSERMRYRREGVYDNDILPVELLGKSEIATVADCRTLLPESLTGREFSAAELTAATGIRNTRQRYYLLTLFEQLGILQRRKDGRRVFYSVVGV